jgi:hypothetical protein
LHWVRLERCSRLKLRCGRSATCITRQLFPGLRAGQ